MLATCAHCSFPLNCALYAIIGNRLYKTCPSCSQRIGSHQFFECPNTFGLSPARGNSHVSMGVQSSCYLCRGNKEAPVSEWSCENNEEHGFNLISSVRLLPMSEERLPSGMSMEDFLTHEIPQRHGTYYFGHSHINNAKGCLFLFQYHGQIIGHAYCSHVERYKEANSDGEHGYYTLNPKTIALYINPLTSAEFSMIDRGITRFNQTSQEVSLSSLPLLFSLMQRQAEQRVRLIMDEMQTEREVTVEEVDAHPADFPMLKVVEGRLIETATCRYERNPAARQACLQHYRRLHNGKVYCEICGFDFESKYGEKFRDYIHIHHLNPLSSFEGEHSIDPIRDLIPVCPNCHAVAHKNTPPYTPDEIRAMMNRTHPE